MRTRRFNQEIDAEDDERLRARCRLLAAPALVVHGEKDPRPIDGPRELAATLPRARFAALANVGHVPWAEHPALVAAELRAFLTNETLA